MNIEYKKDLHHNYMVLAEKDNSKDETYCIKMIRKNRIEGLLSLEQRSIDNHNFFYYDITGKQTLNNLLEKSVLSYDKVKQLFLGLLGIIERAYEYLLNENDLILIPEVTFMDLATDRVSLSYLPGSRKDIKEQMSSFIEYIMNKIDYNDKEAVRLVYNLYAVCKEEGYTFDHLLKVIQSQDYDELQNKPQMLSKHSDKSKHRLEQDALTEAYAPSQESNKRPVKGNSVMKDIPVMMEQVTSEQEIACYPYKTYVYTGGCILGTLIILYLSIATKIIYNTFGNRIDMTKLFALLLMLFCVAGYLINKIWDKKNKITKIIPRQEYIDPREGNENSGISKKMNRIGALNTLARISDARGTTTDKKISTSERRGMSDYIVGASEGLQAKSDNRAGKSDNISENLETNVSRNDFRTGKRTNNANIIAYQPYASEVTVDKDNIYDKSEEDYNLTCLLNATEEKACCLLTPVEAHSYNTIRMEDFPFFIGKLKKNVDYCLEKDVVSRYHAKVTREQDSYYLTDLNSTNGTFINGETLQTYQRKEIKEGDEIAFANLRYIFSQG